MNLTKEEQKNLYIAIRQFLYFMATFAFVGVVGLLTKKFRTDTFNENSVVETIQLLLLLSAMTSFLYCAFMEKKWREISLVLASAALFAACRELDKFFDTTIPVVSWKFAYLFVFASIFYAYKNLKRYIKSSLKFFGMPSFYIMCIAVIVILPVAQCIGHRPLVSAALGTHFGRNDVAAVKELFEEALEAVGYFLILLSSIEYNINIRGEK